MEVQGLLSAAELKRLAHTGDIDTVLCMFTDMQAFRRKLAQSSPCFGVGITFTDPAVSEAVGPSVDFLWIDLEHNPISEVEAQRLRAQFGKRIDV